MENSVKKEIIIEDFKRKRIVAKNIVLLLMGRLVSLFGSSIYSFAIGLYILKVTGSGFNFALTLFLATIPRAIFGPIAGVIADGIDRKKMTVVLDILSGVIVIALWGISMIDEIKLVYIYGTTVLLNICNVFFDTAITSATPSMVDDDNLTRINSLSSAIASGATILGPMVGGLVFALIDLKLFLLVNGLSFVISGISEMFIDFKARDKIYGLCEKNEEKKESSFIQEMSDGFKYIYNTKWLMALGISAAIANMFVIMGLNVSIPVIVNNLWNFTDTQYGILMGAFPAGMIVASIIMSLIPQKEKNYRRIVVGFFAFSLGMVFLGIFASGIFGITNNLARLMVLVILFAILAFASVFLNIPFMVTIQKMIPSERLGRVFGVFGTLTTIMIPIGAILGGFFIDIISPWMLPLACGCIMIVVSVITAKNKELKEI